MALVACRECKREVSTEAETCPGCGVRKPYINQHGIARKDTLLAATRREEIARLQREAADFRHFNSAQAIYLLHRAKTLMLIHPAGHTIESWLRLPNYLLDERRFDEALKELGELLRRPPIFRDSTLSLEETKQPKITALAHSEFAKIYEVMAVAHAWSGDEEKSNECTEIATAHEAEADRLSLLPDDNSKTGNVEPITRGRT